MGQYIVNNYTLSLILNFFFFLNQIVTNGVYKSIEHRAIVNADKERLTIATFYNPKLDGEMGPAPSLISKERPALFKIISVADFYKGFFARPLDGKSYLDTMRIHSDDHEEPKSS